MEKYQLYYLYCYHQEVNLGLKAHFASSASVSYSQHFHRLDCIFLEQPQSMRSLPVDANSQCTFHSQGLHTTRSGYLPHHRIPHPQARGISYRQMGSHIIALRCSYLYCWQSEVVLESARRFWRPCRASSAISVSWLVFHSQ